MVTAVVLVLALVRAGLGLGAPSPGCGTELDLAPGLSHRVSLTLADPLQGEQGRILSPLSPVTRIRHGKSEYICCFFSFPQILPISVSVLSEK